jgi:hypothetical protein
MASHAATADGRARPMTLEEWAGLPDDLWREVDRLVAGDASA